MQTLDPSLSFVEAALRLYVKDEAPMPDRVNNIIKITKSHLKLSQKKKVGGYSPLYQMLGHNTTWKAWKPVKHQMPQKMPVSYKCHLLALEPFKFGGAATMTG